MSKPNWLNNKFLFIFIWIVAIGIRLYGAFRPAQIYDISTFEAWSRYFWIHGPHNFFTNIWSDYLPLPILTFAPISLLADSLHTNFGLTFKLVHIIIELILIYFISKISTKSSILNPISYLLLLSPALIGDTSFWGQVDTIPALLGLLSLCLITPGVKGSHLPAQAGTPGVFVPALLFGLAVAYKPIMILIAPIFWIVDIRRGHYFRFPLISSLVFLATGIPTGGINFFSHLLSRALDQSATYPFLTVNAFNLWSLLPTPYWSDDATTVLSISGKLFGFILFGISLLKMLIDWKKTNFDQRYVYRLAGTILIAFFAFTTRMHERHLLFGLPFLALATIYETWLLVPLLILTATFTLNLWGAFYWVNHAQTWPFDASFISLISWITTLTTILLVSVWSWPNFFKSVIQKIKSNKLLVSVLIVASLLRFVNLSHPPVYIFDEVYHAFTSREYLNNHIEAWEWWTTPPEGVAYEWTHPPVAKYGMVAGMLLFGENSLGWRVGSATFGVLSILGLYLLVLSLTRNKSIALISAFLVSIEGLHIAQSRIAMNDIYMLNFYIWSLYAGVKSRWKLSAILYGLALGSKWSALYGVIPLALIYLNQNLIEFNLLSILQHLLAVIRLLLVVIFTYVLTFAPFILAGHTWEQWWELHRQMWYYHTHLVATHGYQSVPPQWLFAIRPVWYWVDYAKNSISNIYAQSNPLILWFGLLALVLQFKKIFRYPLSIFYLLYAIFTIPWIFSPRIMFFYHYLPSSVFLCVIAGSWLDSLPSRSRNGLMVLCLIGLILISPMLYGFPITKTYWDTLFTIFPSWK